MPRLDDDTPANMALQLLVNASLNRPPDRTWRLPSGRPQNKWLDQQRNDSTRPTGDLWMRTVDRGPGGATMRRPSPATRLWWWWWWYYFLPGLQFCCIPSSYKAAITFCQPCSFIPSFTASPPLAGTNSYGLMNRGPSAYMNNVTAYGCCVTVKGPQITQQAPFYSHYVGQTCVSRHLQVRTGGFCWCKVLLITCPCWRQPAN